MSNPFTREEAKELRSQFLRLIIERDELIEKLELHREVLAELEDVRRFLTSDPTPFTAIAATNGHAAPAYVYAHAPTPEPEPPADVVIDAETQAHIAAVVDQADDDQGNQPGAICHTGETPTGDDAPSAPIPPPATPADDYREQTLVRTHTGETAADRVQAEASAGDRDERPAAKLYTGEALPPADDGPLTCAKADDTALPAVVVSRTGEASTANAAPERPAPDTLLGRILSTLDASDKPLRSWRIQRELGLSRTPTAELSRLIKRGLLERRGEGIYAIRGKTYDQAST